MLGAAGLARGSRVIIEKPFGTDLASARALNQTVDAVFGESQVFRIDHFLGKESVDNILAFRFANGLFEPVWNRKHIAYVQIDVPETLSIEGRGGFYDQTGAYRDMIVTHLFQVLGFVAMEPPASLDARHLREEKVKVFDALKPIDTAHVVRGQYAGYRDEPGVAPDSQTETMAAVRAEVDNWRWAGVPFLLRSGKRLAASRQVITLGFHQPPLRMFPILRNHALPARRNEIVIDFADPGSITISFLAKEPGATMSLGAAEMTFRYADSFTAAHGLEGYERLLLDAMHGDQTLFTSADGIDRLWEISAPLLDDPPPVQPYAPGSWGPQPALDHLAAPYHWHLPEASRADETRSLPARLPAGRDPPLGLAQAPRVGLMGGCPQGTTRRTAMTDPYEPPRPRDYALQEELESLREQEREGHATPKEQRRAEQLERRLRVDEHGAQVRERREQDRAADQDSEEERARRRH